MTTVELLSKGHFGMSFVERLSFSQWLKIYGKGPKRAYPLLRGCRFLGGSAVHIRLITRVPLLFLKKKIIKGVPVPMPT